MRLISVLLIILAIFTEQGLPNNGNQNIGIPHIQNYSPKLYKQHEQNWAVIQDQHGIMYFGNSHGLLDYDGSSWRLMKTHSPDVVRSLAVNSENRIFVGGYNYFGYFTPQEHGKLEFLPLSDGLDNSQKIFGNVRNINIINDHVYFQTDSAIFEWYNDSCKTWYNTGEMNLSFAIRDTLYFVKKGTGLMLFAGDELLPVRGGERFAHQKIFAMTALSGDKILIGTRNLGLFVLSNQEIVPFNTDIDQQIKDAKLTSMLHLADGNIAISTVNSGLIIISQEGRFIQKIDKSKGLPDNTIWSLSADNQYGLWLALNNGISRIEMPSAVTYFDERLGIQGTIESIVAHKGILYFATPIGLFYIDPEKKSENAKKIPDFKPYKLVSNGNSLIASGYYSGTYELINQEMQRISDYSGYSFFVSELNPDRIFIGLDHGLASIYCVNGRWRDEGYLHLNTSPIRRIAETREGDLWLGTSGPQICKISFTGRNFDLLQTKVDFFDSLENFMSAQQNYVFSTGYEIVIGNGNQLLTYNQSQKKFISFEPLRSIISDTTVSFYSMVKDQKNNLWILMNSDDGNSVGLAERQENGTYSWHTRPFLPLAGSYFYDLQPDPVNQNIIWFGGPDGVVRFDAGFKKDYSIAYSCLIRRVNTLKKSVLWDKDNTLTSRDSLINYQKPLNYEENALSFEFSAPFFEHENENLYQYYLAGFDHNWSEWSIYQRAVYTNIPEGDFQFRARAKNLYGNMSREAVYSFTILPPWYRTGWAYGLYIFLSGVLIFGLVKLRSNQLEKEKRALEVIINERTAEIQIKNQQLADQTEKLKELDTLKSRFFANISHEFRTPLTLIIGPVEEMLAEIFKGNPKNAFQVILSNARRLLRLINQLLDLSKLESGNLQLQATLQPISPFLRSVVYSFSSLAETKEIHLEYIDSTSDVQIFFDNDKLEKIMYNLLSNAFKYTPAHGFITVTLKKIDDDRDDFEAKAVQISIHDTGVGIPADQLSVIFDRFTQLGTNAPHSQAGSGIGLALVKELVHLHHGQIEVMSEPGVGSQFNIILPIGKKHLKPDEIHERVEQSDLSPALLDLELAGMKLNENKSMFEEKTGTVAEDIIILLVEDNTDVRSLISHHLNHNYQILEAENGEEGIKIARAQLPDLIISDVMMPILDGYELCQSVKNDTLTSHIPIILLTAKASDEAKIEGLKYGADAYLTKPFNSTELKVRIENLISGRRRLREKFKREVLLEPMEIDKNSLEDQFLRKVHDLIEKNMSDPGFSIDSLYKELAMSQRQFYRKIQALTDQTPGQFIRTMRLKRAMQLLQKKSDSVTQIAYDVGFSNLSYFSKCFREQFGKLPSEFSRQ